MKSKLFLATVCFALGSNFSARAGSTNEPSLLGFTTEGAAREASLEAEFDSKIDRDHLREWMKKITAHPHQIGSAYNHEMGEFMVGLLKSWGYDAGLEEFSVLYPTPKLRLLEMTAPEAFTARLAELPLKEDATSGLTDEQLPVFNVYSIDGDVTGELVYVNYGVPKDYETLAEMGIDVKGKIVISRYGGAWRGIKPKVAAEHGAIACLIYSDPRDDGYSQGDVYPKGAWRNENGAQRGSVADTPTFPGDPLTPGIGATKDAKRLEITNAPTLTKIPVLPISYADALPLLRAMGGPVAPEDWRGSLPITYHLGPGATKAHLKLEFNWNRVTAYDVIAKMPGSERPDEWVVRGNHYDAWVNGAEDPVSGTVTLLEQARILGELAKNGWKPKRTIVFTIWDGEEPGLLGSTEWVETHADELKQKAAVYINSDNNNRGYLHAGGSHTLERFVNEIMRDVKDPERHISVAERLRDLRIVRSGAADRKEARSRADLRIDALGSGSDYSPFLQHLGIASLDMDYGGEGGGGSYHSIYDSFDHYTRFGDTNFAYGVALTQTTGRAVMRFADADVLPFEFSDFADTIQKYVGELTKLADDLREETKENNRFIADKLLEITADPHEPFVNPEPKSEVPFLNFAPLQNAVGALQNSVKLYDAARRTSEKSATPFGSPEKQKALDVIFIRLEQSLTSADGLPRRPWYQHTIYAPGYYTGYGVKTVPGVREAIEQRYWTEADRQIAVAADALGKFTALLDEARETLK